MNADMIVLITIPVVTLAIVLTKTHAAFITLALSGGYMLSSLVAPELRSALGLSEDDLAANVLQAVVLLAPALLIAWRFRRSQRGGGRFVQQLVPAFAQSLLLIVLVFNSFSPQTVRDLAAESYLFGQIDLFKAWLVTFAVATALFDIMVQHEGPKRAYRRHK